MAEVETQQLDNLLSAVRTLAPLIREHADEAERNRRLSPPVVTALAEAGLFRMWIPRALGGLEVSPFTLYRIVEEVAQIDGSTGWGVMIGATTPAVGGYLCTSPASSDSHRDPSPRRRDRPMACPRRPPRLRRPVVLARAHGPRR